MKKGKKKLQSEICYTDFYENPNIQLTNKSRIFFYKLWESLRELVLLWRIGERGGRGQVGRYHSYVRLVRDGEVLEVRLGEVRQLNEIEKVMSRF